MLPRCGEGTLGINSLETLTIQASSTGSGSLPSSGRAETHQLRSYTPSERGRWARVGTGQSGKVHTGLSSGVAVQSQEPSQGHI